MGEIAKEPLTEFQKLAGSLVEPPREPRTRALSGTEKIPLNEFPNLNINPIPNPNPNPNVPNRTLSETNNLPKQSLSSRKIDRETMLKKLHKKNNGSTVAPGGGGCDNKAYDPEETSE